MFRSLDACELDLISKHPSNVLEIRFYKDNIKMTEPGQYVFINVPDISNFQWHPFTLTSAPCDEYMSVHIRAAGDWTKALYNASPEYSGYEELREGPPWSLHVDGPYGAPSQDWFLYDSAVLIGAGIGITPFASILKDVQVSLTQSHSFGTPHGEKRPKMSRKMTRRNTVVLKLSGGRNMRLKKVHLFWLCHDMKCFEWFYGLLQEIEESNHNSLFEIHIHLTRGWKKDADRVKSLIKKDLNVALPDPTTQLSERTYYGRPRWNQVFSQIAEKQKNKSIGVFFCGPKPLGESIRGSIREVNRDYMEDGTHFEFSAEKF